MSETGEALLEGIHPASPTGLGFNFDPIMTPKRKLQKQREKEEMELQKQLKNQPVEKWCLCNLKCKSTGNPVEHVCCKEDVFVAQFMESEIISCITDHSGFKSVVMSKHVLDALSATLSHFLSGDKEKVERLKKPDADTYRHLAYVNFRKWVCKGKKLGKGRRMVTPACVVKLVREKWPSTTGKYTGFQARNSDVQDL